jgi:hypothetical protein
MADYRDLIKNYVVNLKLNAAAPLGGETPQIVEATERLAIELQRQHSRNQTIVWVTTVLWVVLFVVGIGLVWQYRDRPDSLTVVLGGNALVLSGIMIGLRRLWLDASTIGALLAILPGLTPTERAKVLFAFYLRALDAKPAESVKSAA